jgi:hypothetical protein
MRKSESEATPTVFLKFALFGTDLPVGSGLDSFEEPRQNRGDLIWEVVCKLPTVLRSSKR